MRLVLEEETISGGCGVGNLSCFADYDKVLKETGSWYKPEEFNPHPTKPNGYTSGGAGWTSAAFIPNKTCKAAYELFKQNYKIVFQTPVRVNSNSKNKFIFVVYDRRKGRKSLEKWRAECEEHNKEFNYPWK